MNFYFNSDFNIDFTLRELLMHISKAIAEKYKDMDFFEEIFEYEINPWWEIHDMIEHHSLEELNNFKWE